jgi:DNA-binding response OmpR family regulator
MSRTHRNPPTSPVVFVVSHDSLLRWAVYEALTAKRFRVLTCCDDANARQILPQVHADFGLAIVDDDTWPMTRSERNWLHLRWPHLSIVVLAHPGQDLEHRVKELGLADVVLKPFDIAHLVQLVERLVGPQSGAARAAEHATIGRSESRES